MSNIENWEEEFHDKFDTFHVSARYVYPGASGSPRDEFDQDDVKQFIRSLLSSQKEAIIAELEGMKEEYVTFGKNPDMSMPYNQILMGYSEAIDQAITKIKDMKV